MDQKTLDKELFKALNQNDVDGVKKALEKGASGNAVTKKGATPLMIVSKMNRFSMPIIELADLLIEAGADVNYINKKGFTVVSNMMKSAVSELIFLRHLIENHGVNVNQTVKIKEDGELKEFSLLEFAYMNSIDKELVKLLKENGAKSLSSDSSMEEGFNFRYDIMDKGFREHGIYDIISGFKEDSETASDRVPDLLYALQQYIFDEKYLEANDYISEIEEIIKNYGDGRDRLIFMFLKASVFSCVNIGTSSIVSEIKEALEEKNDLRWDFDQTVKKIESSNLREDLKQKLLSLTDLFL